MTISSFTRTGALLLALSTFSFSVQAEVKNSFIDSFLTLQKPIVTAGPVEEIPYSSPLALRSECTSDVASPMALLPIEGLAETEVILDSIINIGEKIWKIVEAGAPVVSINMPSSSALPQGTQCWTDLENWQAPKSQLFSITYKNLLQMTVVRFDYRVIYTAGGSYQGAGQYLANVTVFPAKVQVMWLFTFDAQVEIGDLINLGTRTNPEAGMEVSVSWKVKNPLISNQNTENYFIRGNGEITQL